MTPLVSVIVPVYKVEEYIEQCAESLFQQDWENLEFIFVDNNTPDSSIERLEHMLNGKYSHRKDCTRIIRETEQGLGYARMAGIRAARGEYVIHVDSDDWVETDFISQMARKAVDSNADIVYCDYYKEYGEGKPAKVVRQRDLSGSTDHDFMQAVYDGRVEAYNWNKLVRRSLYRLDTFITPISNMYEDLVFMTQIAYKAQGIAYVTAPLYHYRRRRPGAITQMNWTKRHASAARGLFHFYRHLPLHDSPMDYCKQDLLTRAGWKAITCGMLNEHHAGSEALDYLAHMKCAKGHSVSYARQFILKCYCKVFLLLHPNPHDTH